jgi:predicted nucleic acid-binding protein
LALYYLDTSALVKLYVREPGTDRMLKLVTPGKGDRFAILSLAQVELQSAVRRRQRAGDLAASIADKLLGIFQRHVEVLFEQEPVGDVEIQAACALIDSYGLKTMDAIHLAVFVSLAMRTQPGEANLVSADAQLLRSAEKQNLTILDVSAD